VDYHYGKVVSIFNIKEKDSFAGWGLHGLVKKAFDKTAKGYCLILDVNS